MTEFIGTCHLCRSVMRTGYLIMRFAEDSDSGLSIPINPIMSVSNADMESHGLAIVLKELRSRSVISQCSVTDGMLPSSKTLSKLKRENEIISVELFRDSFEIIRLTPLHAGHGWKFGVRPEEIRELALPSTNEQFRKILNEALDIAT
jgi:hypothetical protein